MRKCPISHSSKSFRASYYNMYCSLSVSHVKEPIRSPFKHTFFSQTCRTSGKLVCLPSTQKWFAICSVS